MQSLFDITRKSSKSNDIELARSVRSQKRVVTSIKGSGNLLTKIQNIQHLVDEKLGKFKEDYVLIQDEDTLTNYISSCLENNVISIDTETTGLDPMLDDIAGICIYTPNEKGAYIPINHINYITNQKLKNQLDISIIRQQFERLYNIKDIIMFNASFDIRFLRNQVGLHKIFCTWDCYLASRLLNENEPSNALKKLHQKYVLKGNDDAFTFDELFKGIPFTMVPLQTALLYAGHDPVITYELYEFQRQYLNDTTDREDMRKLYWTFKNIEMPCVEVIADMEDRGVLFDNDYQQVLSIKYNKLLQDKLNAFNEQLNAYSEQIKAYKQQNVNCKLDDTINISSPIQLAILFYDILKVDVVDNKNPRGTGVEILSKMNNKLANIILEYREVEKLLSTYIDKLPNCVNPNDNRIHCKFNQYGADTGRMSSSNPNLQNIPSHNKDIRKMFVASEGYVLMSSDFSQQEPKALSALCKMQGDSQMYETFMQGKDLYSEIASKAFNKPYEECKEFNEDGTTNKQGKERRTQAKSILLGVLYGRGEKSIAEQLKCSVEKAQNIKESVFRGFPAIKQFEDSSLQMAKELGYVTTISGRKRRLPDLMLDDYEFRYINGAKPDDDLLDFDNEEIITEVPETTQRRLATRLRNARSIKDRNSIINNAKEQGIEIIDNTRKIASATRQCVNSRIQGSAADLTKLAMIELNKNERLKELGFRLLIPVHDEVIAECPKEYAKECSELLASVMSKSAEKMLKMPIKCDVTVTREWYGDTVNL